MQSWPARASNLFFAVINGRSVILALDLESNTYRKSIKPNIPEVKEMPKAELRVIKTKYGHLAGGMSTVLTSQEDVTFIDKNIREFLKKIT